MFGRPRCREWTPLATQQLRLRSLIQIVGYNIRPPEWCVAQCSFYITLHHTTMSAPFYTSERICSPHPKWKEIDSEVTQQISASNVVIRIWCHTQQGKTEDSGDKPNDTILQTWGVYFSGLRYIGANLALNFTSDCFKSNTLVFQMHGGYFCSYKSLKLDIIPGEEAEHGSLSSDSSGKTASKTIETKFLHHHKFKESRSISPNKFSRKVEKEYSKSQSPVDRSFKQNFPTIKTSTSLNINHKDRRYRENSTERRKQDPNYIYEHSPDNLDVMTSEGYVESLSKNASQEDLTNSRIDLSETAENYDLRNESDGVPKYRYLALNFLKSEIRPSYNATKLQKLHLLQYSIKKRQEAVQEIKERIYKKSALTQEMPVEIDVKSRFKSRSQRNIFSPDEEVLTARCSSQSDLREREDTPPVSNGPRLALKLNDLLYYKAKPSPFQRAEHVRMTKQLEILRFKRIILVDERDSKLASIRRLKETHAKLAEENQDLGLELMENYHSLSRRNEDLREMRSSCGALRELSARSHAALCSVRSELMLRVHGIFYIQQKDETTWTIIDVPLPICGDDSPRTSSPVSDSVAAGFAAQAICLTAAILSQPLRYKITLLGSATKILDITPDLPDPNIPLFARGGDAILFRYGMFLLNKCLAQLLWARHLPCADMRPTLHNLHTLLTRTATASSKTLNCEWSCASRTQSLRSLVAGDRGKNTRQFNRFKDAVDGQSPATVMNLRRHRHSRSVGSYNDDQELPNFDASTTSIMGSEPNIYDTKLANASVPQIIPKHNSDTEISRLSVDQNDHKEKVIFTLGDDLNIDVTESEHLVKISSNNGDQMSKTIEDVKQICTEIKDFCTDAVETKNISPDIDIAKYMEQKTESLEESCIDCEFACEGVCDIVCAKNVTDVIVIPSAEAVLASEATEERTDDQNT